MATVTEAVSAGDRRSIIATENPETTGVNFWSFTVADRCINAIAFITTISMFPTLGLLFTVLTPLAWLAVMWRWENGRSYYLLIKWWQDLYLGITRNWEAPGRKKRGVLRRLFNSYPIDFTTGTVGDELGFIDLNRYDAIVLSAKGSEIGAMGLEGQLNASQKIADIGRYVAARVRTGSVGVSYLFRRRPADVFQADANTQAYLDPDVAVPEALLPGINLDKLTEDQRRDIILHSNLDEVRNQIAKQGSEPMRAMVFTLQRDLQVADAIRKGKTLPSDEVPRLTAQDIAIAAQTGLEDAGVIDPHVLDLAELNGYVRSAWDVADIADYQERRQKDDNETVLRRSRIHLPQRRIRPYHDYIVTDNTMHAVLKITKVPPLTRPDYFPQLFRIPWPWISVALVGEAAKSGVEYQVMQRAVALGEILDERFRASKSATTAKKEALRRKREEDLADNPYSQSYVILVAVSCPIEQDPDKDPETLEKEAHRKLEDAVVKVISRIRLMRCEAKRVTGRSRQLENLIMATTGIPV